MQHDVAHARHPAASSAPCTCTHELAWVTVACFQRTPLADVTNTHTLCLYSPPRRTQSAPAAMPLAEGERRKHAPLSPMERAAVVVLSADLQVPPLVAHKVSCTEEAVRRWKRRYDQTGSVEDAPRSGRPRLLKEGARQAVSHHATATPAASTPKELLRTFDFDVCARTIRRTLDDLGLHGRVARFTPPLNEVHRKKRLSFCNGYGGWTAQLWASVLWSDEASVEMGVHGQVWVQRPAGLEWDPRFTVHKAKHPPKCHIWGCMAANGVGRCFIFTEYLDKELMRTILDENLLPSVAQLGLTAPWWFQQDNDPKHTSKLVQAWIHNHGVSCLEWPPYSPDLNPIEHVWTDVKRRVEASTPKTLEELKEELRKQWNATDPAFCQKLVASMPARMQAARAHGGWMSGY